MTCSRHGATTSPHAVPELSAGDWGLGDWGAREELVPSPSSSLQVAHWRLRA
jgi:hypothetical protein